MKKLLSSIRRFIGKHILLSLFLLAVMLFLAVELINKITSGNSSHDYLILIGFPFLVLSVICLIAFIITGIRFISYKFSVESINTEHNKTFKPFKHTVSSGIAQATLALFIIGSAVMATTLIVQSRTSKCISAEQSWHEVGHHECVEFHPSYIYTSWEHNTFIDQDSNYTHGFSVYVPNGSGLSSDVAHSYQNKTIDVTGTITSYKGAPQIMVSDPSQVRIVN